MNDGGGGVLTPKKTKKNKKNQKKPSQFANFGVATGFFEYRTLGRGTLGRGTLGRERKTRVDSRSGDLHRVDSRSGALLHKCMLLLR